MTQSLLTKPHAFITMDIVGDREIRQVWTHPARAQGHDLGLTDDSECVTDGNDITVGFDAWDGVIHQRTDLPAVGPMPQLERKFRSRTADCTYNAPHMHLICSAYQAHKRRITRAIRYPTQVSHILSVVGPSSYKGEPRHRFMDKSIGYMGHIFRM